MKVRKNNDNNDNYDNNDNHDYNDKDDNEDNDVNEDNNDSDQLTKTAPPHLLFGTLCSRGSHLLPGERLVWLPLRVVDDTEIQIQIWQIQIQKNKKYKYLENAAFDSHSELSMMKISFSESKVSFSSQPSILPSL